MDDRPSKSLVDTLSIISHDIRAPLGVILGAVTELMSPQVGELNDEQRALILLVRRSSEKLSRLANNVMFVNRMESQKIELARQKVDMRILVQRSIEAFDRSGELGKIGVTPSLPSEPASASVDAERASQVLANVLANALRFARREVRVRVEPAPEGVAVIVEDDGPGVAAAMLPGLFDRENRPAGAPPITGLGLRVAKGIVDAHGGAIAAENIVIEGATKGARVRVAFPPAG